MNALKTFIYFFLLHPTRKTLNCGKFVLNILWDSLERSLTFYCMMFKKLKTHKIWILNSTSIYSMKPKMYRGCCRRKALSLNSTWGWKFLMLSCNLFHSLIKKKKLFWSFSTSNKTKTVWRSKSFGFQKRRERNLHNKSRRVSRHYSVVLLTFFFLSPLHNFHCANSH